jgi:hypothetical protein
MFEYRVDAFVPTAPGCGTQDAGWDPKRCEEFGTFLNRYGADGWRLVSNEFRAVSLKGCAGLSSKGTWLVCVFERPRQR